MFAPASSSSARVWRVRVETRGPDAFPLPPEPGPAAASRRALNERRADREPPIAAMCETLQQDLTRAGLGRGLRPRCGGRPREPGSGRPGPQLHLTRQTRSRLEKVANTARVSIAAPRGIGRGVAGGARIPCQLERDPRHHQARSPTLPVYLAQRLGLRLLQPACGFVAVPRPNSAETAAVRLRRAASGPATCRPRIREGVAGQRLVASAPIERRVLGDRTDQSRRSRVLQPRRTDAMRRGPGSRRTQPLDRFWTVLDGFHGARAGRRMCACESGYTRPLRTVADAAQIMSIIPLALAGGRPRGALVE